MLAAEFLLLVGVVAVFSAQNEVCKSRQYTTSGECCKQCLPGEGMVKPCGKAQTECEPCLDSETFSENFSHTEQCQKCTQCTGLLRMETPCTDANDAICVCDYGYFYSLLSNRCEACTTCPIGQGVLLRCEPDRDTVCEQCQDDTFSDQDSGLDPCLPCTVCEDQPELDNCSPVRDTICQDWTDVTPLNTSNSPIIPEELAPVTPDVFPTDEPTDGATESMPTVDPQQKKLGLGWGDNLIPFYISILPAVLLGIVVFIILKRCNNCKHANKQEGSNRSGTANPSQTPSPEGEKLHSDSGISVDSQSLQDGQGLQHTVVKMDSPLTLPLHACEEVEKLLSHGCDGDDSTGAMQETDWCNLAGLLGYEEERIASFRQEERPIQALLSDWASQDSASVDTLCTALRKINREDIAQSIMLRPTATSAV
ncbi:tumor necrosis factor receptor superfamily member 16 [Astyanax mexicanus]|uniref:Tumor necrosis factor receptor superfamily member 16 n=1 Tax=Astyanax mexicanus TaxID=7994 RepID=A0A8T2L8J7_ASTMX|nr:tumor necrosis factor receptor superfamily member 16 [Astyanax mexicanus]